MSWAVLRSAFKSLRQLKDVPGVQRVAVRLSSRQVPRTEASFKFSTFKEGGYILLIVPLTTCYLGCWQLKRRKWKLGLIDDLQKRFDMDPVSLPENCKLDNLKDLEFKPVAVRGHFDYSREIYIGPRGGTPETRRKGDLSGQRVTGVHVVTPFILSDRKLTIMVNRGWYSMHHWLDEEMCKKGQVHGERDLVGILRLDQDTSRMFSGFDKPADKNGKKYFLVRKLDLLAKECGAAPIFLDAVEEHMGPYTPRGLKPVLDLRNDHMSYAVTWFGICIISFYLWLTKFRQPATPSSIHKVLTDMEKAKQSKPTKNS